ncbi:hypothetical protein [Polyangium fumosum]|uniref:Uncharacterized protein n=1 Tax=Polyangium fumosum TaxID=889272 RepID=A0A4U1J7R4_9BACT|nr:hypothetical protein [Polyangium fumosum]TKD03393.1 hypothetical protein E8A74_25850 [Polyangium fumosum]
MGTTQEQSFPRLYVLRAAASSRAVVFVKHRQKRWSLHLWDLDTQRVELGAVFSRTLYPRRCDLSPDGRYLLYFAMKAPGSPNWPSQFSGLSRAPWLACLLAWRESGTWTRGMHFSSPAAGRLELPDRAYLHHGTELADRCPWNIEKTTAVQLASERRIGFVEAQGSPTPAPEDVSDEHRRAILCKRRPGGGREELLVTLSPFDEGEALIEGHRNLYSMVRKDGREVALPAYCWLDWLDREHVYGATIEGRIVICALRDGELVETWSRAFERIPARRPAPAWARSF